MESKNTRFDKRYSKEYQVVAKKKKYISQNNNSVTTG